METKNFFKKMWEQPWYYSFIMAAVLILPLVFPKAVTWLITIGVIASTIFLIKPEIFGEGKKVKWWVPAIPTAILLAILIFAPLAKWGSLLFLVLGGIKFFQKEDGKEDNTTMPPTAGAAG